MLMYIIFVNMRQSMPMYVSVCRLKKSIYMGAAHEYFFPVKIILKQSRKPSWIHTQETHSEQVIPRNFRTFF